MKTFFRSLFSSSINAIVFALIFAGTIGVVVHAQGGDEPLLAKLFGLVSLENNNINLNNKLIINDDPTALIDGVGTINNTASVAINASVAISGNSLDFSNVKPGYIIHAANQMGKVTYIAPDKQSALITALSAFTNFGGPWKYSTNEVVDFKNSQGASVFSVTEDGAFKLSNVFSVAEGDGKSNTIQMWPIEKSFCFLTKVDLEDIDERNEHARCRIQTNSTHWELEAKGDSDANAFCDARCFGWY
jgi:hypothetical protein